MSNCGKFLTFPPESCETVKKLEVERIWKVCNEFEPENILHSTF